MPAPAAGAAEPKSLLEKASAKVEELINGDDATATIDTPAPAASAELTTQTGSQTTLTDTASKILPPPEGAYVTIPATATTAADPSTTMPAPAAGAADSRSLLEQVEILLENDETDALKTQ